MALQLTREQPLRERRWIQGAPTARLQMQFLQADQPLAHQAIRVVELFQRLLHGRQRVLREFDDLARLIPAEQLVERVDGLFDPRT